MEQILNDNEETIALNPIMPEIKICKKCNLEIKYNYNPEWRDTPGSQFLFKNQYFVNSLAYKLIPHEGCEQQIQLEAQQELEKYELERKEFDKIRRKEERMEHVKEWYLSSKLPIEAEFKTFESYSCSEENMETFNLMKAWNISDDFGFLIMGPSGTGKSHLALAISIPIFSNYIETDMDIWVHNKNLLPFYINAAELLASQRGEPKEKILERTINVKYLILDDIGGENITDWSREIFFRIFEYRLNKRLPTFVTTNLSLNELKDRLHERVLSRMLGLCVPVQLKGSDFRRNVLKDRISILKARKC